MKSFHQGYEEGEALCKDVENGVASLKRIITIAKKKQSEYEEGKSTACGEWLRWNKKRFTSDIRQNRKSSNESSKSPKNETLMNKEKYAPMCRKDIICNKTNNWCSRDGILCEHNLEDSPMIRRNVCSGIGGKCKEGSAYSPSSSKYHLMNKGYG